MLFVLWWLITPANVQHTVRLNILEAYTKRECNYRMVSSHLPQPKTELEVAARRAIISAVPEYFTWNVAKQEHYRADMPEGDRLRIQQVLLKLLFGIKTKTDQDVQAILNDFDTQQYLLLNSTMLLLTGIGDDYFFLNESMAENTCLLDFETVYDYDLNDYEFQQHMRQKDNPDYSLKPYQGYLYFVWARLHINGVFHYANLHMVAGYVNGKLEDFGFDQINKLIPHDYVEGKNHRKKEDQGRLYDMEVDAGGLEGQLEELQNRYYNYIQSRYEAIQNDYDSKTSKQVYLVDSSSDIEPSMNFIFTDKAALQVVRFRHFVADCQAIKGNIDELENLVAAECEATQLFLQDSYQNILANFDPQVVKFPKKRKIIIADGIAYDWL